MDTALVVSATEFKAKCLEMFGRLESGELSEVVVTRRGKPVSRRLPPRKPELQSLWGFAKGSIQVVDAGGEAGGDVDGPALDVTPHAAREDITLEQYLTGDFAPS